MSATKKPDARKQRAQGKAVRPTASPEKKAKPAASKAAQPKSFARTGGQKLALMQDKTDAAEGKFTVIYDGSKIMSAGDVLALSKEPSGKSQIKTMEDYHNYGGEVHYQRL